MSTFHSLNELAPFPIWDGILARRVEGREITFAVVELDAGATAMLHHHPQEQLGIVLKGRMHFVIGGEKKDLGPGDTYVIPGNVPHEAKAGPEGAVVIDVFAPIRHDWHRLEPAELTAPRWP